MNTFAVLYASIVNVKLSAGWIDLKWETPAMSACMSFNFLKQSQSSSINGTNVLFL